MTMMNEAALETLGSLAIQSQLLLVIQVKRSMPNTWEHITMIPIEVGNLAIVDLVAKVAAALVSLQETHMEEEDPMRCLLLQPSDAASGFILPMNVGISRDDNDPNDIPRFRCICLGYSIMMM
ncbi:ran-binding protein 6 [Capsicum annuum]